MASIQKKKNSKGAIQYCVSYELPKYVDGKRRKTTKTFPVGTTLSEVKQFIAEKEVERNRSALVSTDYNLTLNDYAEIYFKTYTNFLSPTTLKGYKSAYYNSKPYGIKNYFNNAKIRKIQARNIQEYVNELCRHLSPKSTKNYLMLLNVIFELAVQDGIIQNEANPMKQKIRRPKQERKEVEAYNLEEMQKILKLAEEDENPDIKLILNLALLSGIRRGELCALRWQDIFWEERYIFIHETRVVVEGGVEHTKPPKTNAGIRRIYIPQHLINVLKEYRQRYLMNKVKFGKDFADKNYVVSKPDGNPFTPQGISNCYLRFMRRHQDEIRYLKFHGLRHTYASILIEQGENPKTVQHNLGHADVSLTLQIYSHSYESAQKKAAETLNDTINRMVQIG